MQGKQCPNILQAKNGSRKNPLITIIGRKKLSTISAEQLMLYLIAYGKIQIDGKGRFYKGSKRAEHRTPQGYLQLTKMINRKRYHANAHRVVWVYSNGPIPPGFIVHHINGQKDDNRIENLAISTYSDNLKHAHKEGLMDQFGQKNPRAKLTDKQVAEIRLAYSEDHYNQKEIGDKYGVCFQTISSIVRGKHRKKQGGRIGDYTARRQGHSKRNPKTGRFS